MKRAHQIVEDMIAFEQHYTADSLARLLPPGEHEAKIWNWVKSEALRDTVTFDFRGCEFGYEHYTFAAELMRNGQFRLPFSNVYYQFEDWAVLACQAAPETVERGAHPFTLWSIQHLCDDDDGRQLHGPSAVVGLNDNETFKPSYVFSAAFDVTAAGPDKDVQLNESYQTIAAVLAATVVLMTKEIRMDVEPAPAKLNANRAKAGRPPIGEVRTIRLRPEFRRQGTPGAGTHASPRMHFRRGHFATLHRGTDKQRVIARPPTIVNGTGDAKDLVRRDYVVGAGAGTMQVPRSTPN